MKAVKSGDRIWAIKSNREMEVIGVIGDTVIAQCGDECESLEPSDWQETAPAPAPVSPAPAVVAATPAPAPAPEPEPVKPVVQKRGAVHVAHDDGLSTESTLQERAVLMRFSAGWPGEERQDKSLTDEIKKEKALGRDAGGWEKKLFPKKALAAIKTKISELRSYHNWVTFPFDTGIGILPATYIEKYGQHMSEGREQLKGLIEKTFLANPTEWVVWALKEHNGTFDPDLYPGCQWKDPDDHSKGVDFDPEQFRKVMRTKFYLETEPLPVPTSNHFTSAIAGLLGTDIKSVDNRVADASRNGKVEIMRRLLEPVRHMIEVLSKEDPRIFDTLTSSITEICEIAPHLNIDRDPQIAAAIKAVSSLARFDKSDLKKEKGKQGAKAEAEALLNKLSGYKF